MLTIIYSRLWIKKFCRPCLFIFFILFKFIRTLGKTKLTVSLGTIHELYHGLPLARGSRSHCDAFKRPYWPRVLQQEKFRRLREGKKVYYFFNVVAFVKKESTLRAKMVYFCAPTYNHSTESHTCKFFPFQSAVKAKDKYKRWIPPIRLVTVFI